MWYKLPMSMNYNSEDMYIYFNKLTLLLSYTFIVFHLRTITFCGYILIVDMFLQEIDKILSYIMSISVLLWRLHLHRLWILLYGHKIWKTAYSSILIRRVFSCNTATYYYYQTYTIMWSDTATENAILAIRTISDK